MKTERDSGWIVDASVAVKWVVEEEFSDAARLLAGEALYAPDLLYIECANILWKKAMKGDLTPSEAARALSELRTSPVKIIVSAPVLERALAMAEVLRHPVYDCVYLALAAEKKMPLVTADERLVRVVAQRKLARVKVQMLKDLRSRLHG